MTNHVDKPAHTPKLDERAEVVERLYDRSIRYLIEISDRFAVARWPREADVATIARCILGTLKYEPHAADTTLLRRALKTLIEPELATAHKFAEGR
jgi:hypothetical protein